MSTEGPTVPVPELMLRKASLFPNLWAPKPTEKLTLEQFLSRVKNGFWKKQIEIVRSANLNSKEDAKKPKEKLPVLKPSGIFSGLSAQPLAGDGSSAGLRASDRTYLGHEGGGGRESHY